MTEEYDALRQVLTDNAVAYHPAYARIGGSVTAGILLAQLMHWTRYSKTGWVFRTQAQIESETALTEHEQNEARRKLRVRGLIIEKRHGIPAQLYYQPQFDAIRAALETLPPPAAEPPPPDDPESAEAEGAESTDDATRGTESAPQEGRNPHLKRDGIRTSTHESDHESKYKTHEGRVLFSALAKTCSINTRMLTDKQRGALNSTEKLLRDEGAKPEQLAAFREWWDREDWRGKRGQAPEPHQVREQWDRFQQTNGKPGTIKTWVS